MTTTPDDRRPGFGIVGLALAGFLLVGPGLWLVNSGRPILGWALSVIGALPLLYDIVTVQPALILRLLSVALPARVAYVLCSRLTQ